MSPLHYHDFFYKNSSRQVTVSEMLNEAVWDAGLAGTWSYVVSQHGSTDPLRFVAVSAICGFSQPALTYAGFDGIFKKRVNFLSPMLSITFGYGLALGTQYAFKLITLSDDARFYAITSAAYLAIVKGLTRKVFNTSPYPPLAPLVTVPASGITSLYENISSLYSQTVSSQFVKSKIDAIYWAFARFKGNPCQDPGAELKEM